MRFDNIFVSKGNGSGWTLNFANPVSWVILLALVGVVVVATLPQFKRLYYYFRSRQK